MRSRSKLSHLWSLLSRRSIMEAPRPTRPQMRLRLEELEERTVPASPIVEYNFDMVSPTTAINTGTLGTAANGTFQNGTDYSTDTPTRTGHSLLLDGHYDYVSVPDTWDYTSQLTVEAWIKPNAVDGQRVVWDDYGNPGVFLAIDNGQLEFGISTTSNPGLGKAIYAGKIVPGQWQHVAGVYDGSRMIAYVNGIPVGCVPNTGSIIDNGSYAAGLGRDNVSPALYFQGKLDDFRIFNNALAPTDLAAGSLVNNSDFARFYTIVTTTDDVVTNDCDVSLREAINYANTHPGTDTITFAPALTQNGAVTILLDGTQLPVLSDTSGTTTIQGPGQDLLSISGNDTSRVFAVAPSTTAELDDLTVAHGNTIYDGHDPATKMGGGIDNQGSLTIQRCTLSDNAATSFGGAVYNEAGGRLSVVDGRFEDNVAGANGGNFAGTGGAAINNGGTLIMTTSVIHHNTAANAQYPSGGAIQNGGSVTLDRCTLDENTASYGGAVFNWYGTVNVLRSTIASNHAGRGNAGGIDNEGGTVTISDSTLANNDADIGGAIYNYHNGTVTIANSTIAANRGPQCGGIYDYPSSSGNTANSVSLANCIVAGNFGSPADLRGPITSLGHNLIGQLTTSATYTAGLGDLTGTAAQPLDPLLAVLANNGGPTWTMAPKSNSPVVDAGDDQQIPSDPATGSPFAVDQRGLPRIVGRAVDIGAVEAEMAYFPPVLDPIGDQTVTEGQVLSFQVSAHDDPSDQLTFSLTSAPDGASIDATGVVTWATTEADGPGTYSFTIRVTDQGNLYDEKTITVTVAEVNQPPVLDPIAAQQIDEGQMLTFQASATDADLPANTLTYSLSGAPAGASIDPTSGVFTWTPAADQGPQSYTFNVQVTDGNSDPVTQSVTVTVNDTLSPFTVTNTNDSGPGSLRQAMINANAHAGTDTITFAIPGSGVHTITPQSPLPTVTDPAVIDGSTEPGYACVPIIEINGTSAGSHTSGLTITGGASMVRGLIINHFDNAGIDLQALGGNIIVGCYIGTDATGEVDSGNRVYGVRIDSPNNRIGTTAEASADPCDRNVISGNDFIGVRITDNGPRTGNVIAGNYIGIDATGTVAIGNRYEGISIGSASTIVGGTTEAGRNVISGNQGNGVTIEARNGMTIVQGNFIGTDVTGTRKLGNHGRGIEIRNSPNNFVGGTTDSHRNLISGNGQQGVLLNGAGTLDNLIQGNYIGTDATGSGDLGNGSDGIWINGAPNNLIGGTEDGARNVISGNKSSGIYVVGSASQANRIEGNYIGTDSTGTQAQGNWGDGILIQGAIGTIIGSTTTGTGNVISGNGGNGINIQAGPLTPVANLSIADQLIAGTLPRHTATATISTADLSDAARSAAGNWTDDNPIPGGGGDNYTVRTTGTLQVNTAGTFTFALGSDDGGRLRIDGLDVIVDNSRHAFDVRFGQAYLSVGTHTVEWVGFENGGYAGFELSVAVGADQSGPITTANGWHVLGDPNLADEISLQDPLTVTTYYSDPVPAQNNQVAGNLIGLNAAGDAILANAWSGVYLASPNNTIGGTAPGAGNVISGNGQFGISIGAGGDNSRIQGNYIGTDKTGGKDLGNTWEGILVSGAAGTIIGGTEAGARNVISGNDRYGVYLLGANTTNTDIQGNYIGTDATGSVALGNRHQGVRIENAPDNWVGGTDASARNVISGNQSIGVALIGTQAIGNRVYGNFIGTDVTGTSAVANQGQGGIYISAAHNFIGGTDAGMGNLISGNTHGFWIEGATTTDNWIQGNFIGTDVTGTKPLSNSGNGIWLLKGANGNIIGGTDLGAGNVISGNSQFGIALSNSSDNAVRGNYIGTDLNGTQPLGNTWDGVYLDGASSGNLIGGTAPGAGNVISGNHADGVHIVGAATTGNFVQGNLIGLDASGETILSNRQNGVEVAAAGNTIGGAEPGAGNAISGNFWHGVDLVGGATGNTVEGNRIGTDKSGTVALGNNAHGLAIYGAAENLITGNVISGNHQYGLSIGLSSSTGNRVEGNYVGTDVTGTQALGNTWSGVYLYNDASDNIIGGDTEAARNVISGNSGSGVRMTGANTRNNAILGNYIGTDATGTRPLGNHGQGAIFLSGATQTRIGGTEPGAGNVIAGNQTHGIYLSEAGTTGNEILGNFIGTNAVGAAGLGNTGYGVYIYKGASDNQVGEPGAGNVISGNGGYGMVIDNEAINNSVQANTIGLNPAGDAALPNAWTGIYLGAPGNSIGGTASGAGNVISGNGLTGISLVSAAAQNSRIEGNLIGTDRTGTLALGNGGDGIFVSGASGATIGGTDPAARNVISGNGGNGITVQDGPAWPVTSLHIVGQLQTGELPGHTATATVAEADFADGPTGELGDWGYNNPIPGGGGSYYAVVATGTLQVATAGTFTFALSGDDGGRLRIDGSDVIVDDGLHPFQTRFGQLSLAAGTHTLEWVGFQGGGEAAFELSVAVGAGQSGPITTANGWHVLGDPAPATEISLQGLLTVTTYYSDPVPAQNNQIAGNYIGLNAAGDAILANAWSGVYLASPNNTIGGTAPGAGNVISGNGGNGVSITGAAATGNVVQGNYIGTDATGTLALGNGNHGVFLTGNASANSIGGTVAGARNVISGNNQFGVVIGDGTGNAVQGNYIGTDLTGTKAVGNLRNGVYLYGNTSGNIIGGAEVGAGNVISGNSAGIRIGGANVAGNRILGNLIGTDWTGTARLANWQWGIVLYNGTHDNQIGGPAAGEGNVIAFNAYAGVAVDDSSTGNALRGNSIYANGGRGIDLNDNGVTPNDLGDADTGPNNYQNFPGIGLVEAGAATHVTGLLSSQPNTTYTLDFYANVQFDPSGNGEGQRYLGSAQVTTDINGEAHFDITLSAATAEGEFITATATDPNGNTSEFSGRLPTANAGGIYQVDEGNTVPLNGSGSSDPDQASETLKYEWDLDGDGVYETTGSTPTFSAATLDGPTSHTVTLRVTDASGLYDVATATIEVLNVAPTAREDTATVAEDSLVTIAVLGNDSDPAAANDPLVVVALTQGAYGTVSLNADGTLTYTPDTATEATSDHFSYTIADGDGGLATATVSITISHYSGVSFSEGILRIGGTPDNDSMLLTYSGDYLVANGKITNYRLADIQEVRVWGRGGNDLIDLAALNVKSVLYGGDGNDILMGGQAGNLIFGGVGRDVLLGGQGNDFLIGGLGSDLLLGAAGNDILTAGEIATPLTESELWSILASWVATRQADLDFASEILDDTKFSFWDMLTRAIHSFETGQKPGSEIFNSGPDILSGNSGADWFLMNAGDILLGKNSREGDVATSV